MGRVRIQMEKWWRDGDRDAYDWLHAADVLHSDSRDRGNVCSWVAEYLAYREFGGTRLRQSEPTGDLVPKRRRRKIEVKGLSRVERSLGPRTPYA